jgi:hypothetical protein
VAPRTVVDIVVERVSVFEPQSIIALNHDSVKVDYSLGEMGIGVNGDVTLPDEPASLTWHRYSR